MRGTPSTARNVNVASHETSVSLDNPATSPSIRSPRGRIVARRADACKRVHAPTLASPGSARAATEPREQARRRPADARHEARARATATQTKCTAVAVATPRVSAMRWPPRERHVTSARRAAARVRGLNLGNLSNTAACCAIPNGDGSRELPPTAAELCTSQNGCIGQRGRSCAAHSPKCASFRTKPLGGQGRRNEWLTGSGFRVSAKPKCDSAAVVRAPARARDSPPRWGVAPQRIRHTRVCTDISGANGHEADGYGQTSGSPEVGVSVLH